MAILTAMIALAWPTAAGQVLPIIAAGFIGWYVFPPSSTPPELRIRVPISHWVGMISWVFFFGFLLGLPLVRQVVSSQSIAVFDSFYRAGALVFGGGHVVLPLLQAGVVAPGWVTNEQFVAGYGAAQAVPGPLFTFAAYLGFVMRPEPNGLAGAALALVAIFLPGLLMTAGALPFWDSLRSRASFQSAIRGVNAAVVGLLLAAFYNPVWKSAIFKPVDFGLAILAFGLLAFWKLPPWLVVVLTAVGGEVIARI